MGIRLNALSLAFLVGGLGSASDLWVTNSNADGPGSLRSQIGNAQSGDTILFDPAHFADGNARAIALNGEAIRIDKPLTINASAIQEGVAIDANHMSRIFDIMPSGGPPIDLSAIPGVQVAQSTNHDPGGIGADTYPATLAIDGDPSTFSMNSRKASLRRWCVP